MEKVKNRTERSECSNFEVEKCGDDSGNRVLRFFVFGFSHYWVFPRPRDAIPSFLIWMLRSRVNFHEGDVLLINTRANNTRSLWRISTVHNPPTAVLQIYYFGRKD